MANYLSYEILENLSQIDNSADLNSTFQTLFSKIRYGVGIEPIISKVKITWNHEQDSEKLEIDNIFNLGVKRYNKKNTLIIEIYGKDRKFLPFILLREIYNLFAPEQIRSFESVQLVINQIIIAELPKHKNLNEWKELIKENLEHYDSASKGFDRLTPYDRLSSYFNIKGIETYNPIKFFFQYIRKNQSLMTNKLDDAESDIHVIFFFELERHIKKILINDDIVETIRCINFIFNKVKHYKEVLQYKTHFQKFKANGQLKTELSLRKFIHNMEKIKSTFIAPSYKVNWKTLDAVLICVFVKFNPVLNKAHIFKIFKKLPFINNLKISRTSFGLDLYFLVYIPKAYLNSLTHFFQSLKKKKLYL